MMNKLTIYLFALVTLLFSSCIEQDELVYQDTVVEFDAATWEARSVVNGVAKDYLLLTRLPVYGWPTSTTTDPLIRRTSGTIKVRVNLVGAHRANAEEISYKVVANETNAIAGTHYNTTGKVTIPAGSSYGEVAIEILDPGPSETPVDLVLELEGNGAIKPNKNYARLGIRISQL